MTVLESMKQLEPCLKQIEDSLLSFELWNDLARPISASIQILRKLVHLSSSFPTLKISNNALINANRIFENGIMCVDNMVQFHALFNGLLENSVEGKLCSKIRCNLKEVLDKLDTGEDNFFGFLGCELIHQDLSSECHRNLALHLCTIQEMMSRIHELLVFFKSAFLACDGTLFGVEEFSKVSFQLKDIIAMLHTTTVATHTPTAENTFLTVFFSALDRPIKIAMNALSLLFTFPALEHTHFKIIHHLCQNALQIFLRSICILKDLSQFFLKDINQIQQLQDKFLRKIQTVDECCREMFEQSLTENSVETISSNLLIEEQKNVDKPPMLESISVSGALSENSMKSKFNRKTTVEAQISFTPFERLETSCNLNLNSADFSTTKEILTDSSQHSYSSNSMDSSSVLPGTTKNVQNSIMPETLSVKSLQNVFLHMNGINLNSVSVDHKKFLQELIGKIKCNINYFSLNLKTSVSEFQVSCKICGEVLRIENIEGHINDKNHIRNLYERCKNNPKDGTVLSEIREENKKFLNFDSHLQRYSCCLCFVTLGNFTQSWVHHFCSMVHRAKLKESKSISDNMKTLKDYSASAQYFQDSQKIHFPLLECGQKQQVGILAAELKYAINFLSIEKKSKTNKLSFFCHACNLSVVSKKVKNHISDRKHVLNVTSHDKVSDYVPEPSNNCAKILNQLAAKKTESDDKIKPTEDPVRNSCGKISVKAERQKTAKCSRSSSTHARAAPYTKPGINTLVKTVQSVKEELKELNFTRPLRDHSASLRYFKDSLMINFPSLEFSQKRRVEALAAKLKDAINFLSIEKKSKTNKLSFFCHACNLSVVSKKVKNHISDRKHVLNVTSHDKVSDYVPEPSNNCGKVFNQLAAKKTESDEKINPSSESGENSYRNISVITGIWERGNCSESGSAYAGAARW